MAEVIFDGTLYEANLLQLRSELQELKGSLDLHQRALCTLIALITGQPVMTDELKGLLKELGFKPVSPLLVPGAVVGKPS